MLFCYLNLLIVLTQNHDSSQIQNMKLPILVLSLLVATTTLSLPKKYGRFYVSGQPSEQELLAFKNETGAVVLDLRSIDELGNCSEPATVSKLGLRYGRVLFEKTAPIEPSVIAEIDKQVKAAKDEPVFLFCKTGTRAAAWLTIYLVKNEKKSIEEALSITKSMGLKPEMEKLVRSFLALAPSK